MLFTGTLFQIITSWLSGVFLLAVIRGDLNAFCKDYKRQYPDQILQFSSGDIFTILYPKPIHEIEDVLMNLEEQKYISKYPPESKTFYRVEYAGKRYKEFRRIKLRTFIIESVFVPIIVTIMVTLITMLISGFFKPQ